MRRRVRSDKRELLAPPHKPVVWLVRRRDSGRGAHVVAQTAYFALQQGAVVLKDSAASPCLDLDRMTATVRDAA
jgi:hypothetical protein